MSAYGYDTEMKDMIDKLDRQIITRNVYEFLENSRRIPTDQQQKIEKMLGKKILPRRSKIEKVTVTKYWIMDEFGYKYCVVETPWGMLIIPEGGSLSDAVI